jgi:ADP-heptose:LPS heptosyltransferase
VNRGDLLRIGLRLVRGPARRLRRRQRRAVIFKLDRIGDFVLATGAIRTLLAHFGPENSVLVVSPAAAELAAREFPAVEQIAIPLEVATNWRGMRCLLQCRHILGGYDFRDVVSLRHQPDRWQNLVLGWLRAPRRHVLPETPWRPAEGAADRANSSPVLSGTGLPLVCLELENHRALVSQTLGRTVSHSEILPALAKARRPRGDYILVSPFGSAGIRDLPRGPTLAALGAVFRETGLRIRLSASRQDADRAELLKAELCAQGTAVDPVMQTSLLDHLEDISGSAVVLSAETGTAHLATALDLPTVVLLGGGHFGLCAPWRKSKRQEWLSHPVPCFHCNWRCHHPEPFCLTGIAAIEIRAAVQRVLDVD